MGKKHLRKFQGWLSPASAPKEGCHLRPPTNLLWRFTQVQVPPSPRLSLGEVTMLVPSLRVHMHELLVLPRLTILAFRRRLLSILSTVQPLQCLTIRKGERVKEGGGGGPWVWSQEKSIGGDRVWNGGEEAQDLTIGVRGTHMTRTGPPAAWLLYLLAIKTRLCNVRGLCSIPGGC